MKPHFEHLYISVGATFDEEIEATAQFLRDHAFTYLHCVTIYPTPLNEMHLARLAYLSQFTPSVGFSDHSLVARDGIKASVAAMAMGADVVERHFTVLAPNESRDGPVSINPTQLKELVDFSKQSIDELKEFLQAEIPEFEDMIGKQTRELSQAELLNRDYYRGRFASKVNDDWVYNWEEKPITK